MTSVAKETTEKFRLVIDRRLVIDYQHLRAPGCVPPGFLMAMLSLVFCKPGLSVFRHFDDDKSKLKTKYYCIKAVALASLTLTDDVSC